MVLWTLLEHLRVASRDIKFYITLVILEAWIVVSFAVKLLVAYPPEDESMNLNVE
jgi:hypothetical protein